MKKIILGFLSIVFASQISFAQPVSDMAVIPMGITIQNIMRLTITRGGNIEFVFKSANDRTNGIGPTGYQTAGNVVATQAWNIELTTDHATSFVSESGVLLPLTAVYFTTTCATATVPAAGTAQLSQGPTNIITGGPVTAGTTFTIDWECGTTPNTTGIPVTTAAGRYAANIILSLIP